MDELTLEQPEKVEGTTLLLLSAEEYERIKDDNENCSLIPCKESNVRILRVETEKANQ